MSIDIFDALQAEIDEWTSALCSEGKHLGCKMGNCWCHCHTDIPIHKPSLSKIELENHEVCKLQKWSDQINLDMFACAEATVLSPTYYITNWSTLHPKIKRGNAVACDEACIYSY